MEQLLLQGEIDLGVVVLPADAESFEIVPIVEKRLHLVLPRSHRLSSRPRVRLADLRDDPFILFRQEFNLHDRVKDACIREGFEPKVAHESTQWDYMYELVRTGQGVALLPETVCAKFAADKDCAVRRISGLFGKEAAMSPMRRKAGLHSYRKCSEQNKGKIGSDSKLWQVTLH